MLGNVANAITAGDRRRDHLRGFLGGEQVKAATGAVFAIQGVLAGDISGNPAAAMPTKDSIRIAAGALWLGLSLATGVQNLVAGVRQMF